MSIRLRALLVSSARICHDLIAILQQNPVPLAQVALSLTGWNKSALYGSLSVMYRALHLAVCLSVWPSVCNHNTTMYLRTDYKCAQELPALTVLTVFSIILTVLFFFCIFELFFSQCT